MSVSGQETRRISLRSFSVEAVVLFIKFLYGYELEPVDLNNDIEVVKELIAIGGILNIDSLQRAATTFLLEHFPEESLLDTLDMVKTIHAREADTVCTEFILRKFERNAPNSNKIITKSLMKFSSTLLVSLLEKTQNEVIKIKKFCAQCSCIIGDISSELYGD